MIDHTDLDSRMLRHSLHIARADHLAPHYLSGTQRPPAYAWAQLSSMRAVRHRSAIELVRLAALLLDLEPGVRLSTGRIVRQPSSSAGPDGQDHPVRLGIGPDGALYLTYPAGTPGSLEPPGTPLRIVTSDDHT